MTLVELLIVVVIIGLISAVALPTVIPALNRRQASEAGRILQGALVGARDRAIHDGAPSGIRLLPDPSFPLRWQGPKLAGGKPNPAVGQLDTTAPMAYSRMIPIGPAPNYQEGMVTIPAEIPEPLIVHDPSGQGRRIWNPDGTWRPITTLVLEQAMKDPAGAPNTPTSWFWNVRVGDKIQIRGAGPWYTVVGPMWWGPADGNTEMFVNCKAPGSPTPFPPLILPRPHHKPLVVYPEFLLLADGRDDDGNGWVDDGWNGVDNNGDGQVDEPAEWEPEAWQGSLATAGATSVPYVISRRPMPTQGAREISLPSSIVIDATTAFLTQERSRLPIDPRSGTVDILVHPDGTVTYSLPYGVPTSVHMGGGFMHFWLADRSDVAGLPLATDSSGAVIQPPTPAPLQTIDNQPRYLPISQPGSNLSAEYPGPYLAHGFSILSLSHAGRISVVEDPSFLDDFGAYNATFPFLPAEQGVNMRP